jgi:hypothetical protein
MLNASGEIRRALLMAGKAAPRENFPPLREKILLVKGVAKTGWFDHYQCTIFASSYTAAIKAVPDEL